MEKDLLFKFEDNFHWKGSSWSYLEGLEFQETVVQKYNSTTGPQFIASEHAPVFSVGNSLKIEGTSINNIPIVPVERGGKAMFHGPGQLTIYPIIKISDYFKGPRDYVCFLFTTLKEYFLEEHNIKLTTHDNGLWTVDTKNQPLKKIGFIGLRIKNGISYHGFSLNYFCDLENFKVLSPCNISGEQVGNLFKHKVNLERASRNIISFIDGKLKL